MSVKHKNNLLSLTIFAVLAAAAFFALILNRQLSSDTVRNSTNLSRGQSSNTLESSNTDQADNLSDPLVERKIEQNAVTENFENNSPKSGFIKDETTVTFTGTEQKKAQQLINQFENYFAQANFERIFELFLTQIRDSKTEENVVAKSRILPKSYNIKAIDIRNDSTVIAKIVETRADITTERYLELAPIDSSYKISRYFSSEDQLTYGGF